MKTNDPWRHVDAAFCSMDQTFQELGHAVQAAQSYIARKIGKPKKTHVIVAETWRDRRRAARLFLLLAWRIVVNGRVTVRLPEAVEK